jgi:hypothetical protein
LAVSPATAVALGPRDEVKRLLQERAADGALGAIERIREIANGGCVQNVRGPDGKELEGVKVSASPGDSIRAFAALAEVGDVMRDREKGPSQVTVVLVARYE